MVKLAKLFCLSVMTAPELELRTWPNPVFQDPASALYWKVNLVKYYILIRDHRQGYIFVRIFFATWIVSMDVNAEQS